MNRDWGHLIGVGFASAFMALVVMYLVGLIVAWFYLVISSAIANGFLWAVLSVAGVLLVAFITGVILAWKGN